MVIEDCIASLESLDQIQSEEILKIIIEEHQPELHLNEPSSSVLSVFCSDKDQKKFDILVHITKIQQRMKLKQDHLIFDAFDSEINMQCK